MMRRRDFLKVSLTSAGALFVGVSCGSPAVRNMRETIAKEGNFQPAGFLTITPDDEIRVGMGKAEMGQGTYTTHAILVAEELEVPVERLRVFGDVAGPTYEVFGLQITGGSTSTPDAWLPIRTAAAAARLMLVAAAAETWGCKVGECAVEDGVVVHRASDRRLRYGELVEEAARRDIPEDVGLKPRERFTRIGQSTPRVDLLPKVTGAPIFGMDVQVEGMVKAIVLRPPVFGGKPTRIDAAKAKGMVGVIDVIEIRSGVAVVADKYWQARRAAPEVVIEWDAGINGRLDSDALMRAAIAESEKAGHEQRAEGDIDAAFEAAAGAGGAKVVEGAYRGPFLAHAPMEPMNATAHVEKDRVRVWVGTQFQSAVRSSAATQTGVDIEKVEVYTTYLGGGFGRRGVIDVPSMAVEVSQRLGRPAQVIWSREEDTRGGFYRPLMVARMKGVVSADGKPTALSAHALSQSLFNLESIVPGFVPGWLPAKVIARAAGHMETSDSLPNVLATEGLATMTYAIPNVRVAYTPIRVNVPVTFWRSVGHSVNGFAMEGFINELATAADADPFEFRRGLLGNDPRKRAVLEAVAELSAWGAPIEDGWGRGIAAHMSFGTYCAQVVEAGVFDGEIKVRKVFTALDCGQIINPDQVRAQIESSVIFGLSAALWGRIDIREGRVQQGNYDDYRILRMHECPEMQHVLIDSTESPTGTGEPALPAVAPALAGALFAVTGKRLRSMPMADALEEASR